MPATKPERSVKLTRDDESGLLILSLSETRGVRNPRKTTSYYRVERNPNAKLAFRLHKLVHEGEEPVTYDTLIAGDRSSCDCIGFTQHRHCRHVESLTALIEAGKLS